MDEELMVNESVRQLLIMLKQRKEELHLTYDNIAERSGLSKNCVSTTMSPQSLKTARGIHISTLLKLCHALELRMWFAREEEIDYHS